MINPSVGYSTMNFISAKLWMPKNVTIVKFFDILFELVVDCMSEKGLSIGKLLMFSHYIILNLNTYVTVKILDS